MKKALNCFYKIALKIRANLKRSTVFISSEHTYRPMGARSILSVTSRWTCSCFSYVDIRAVKVRNLFAFKRINIA